MRTDRTSSGIASVRAALWLTTALALPGIALAQAAAPAEPAKSVAAMTNDSGQLDEIVVTAQKRTETLQSVPISIQVLGTKKLDELQVNNFNDYVKFLPSVSFSTVGPGFAQVYFRGVASGGDGNHSGPLPSVGIYLDEQPITTIQGALDIHVYDIARVEALAGPQGTLYGASSEAGTIRIITNKPDPTKFSASYDLELNKVGPGGVGGIAEGYVNVPLTDRIALRVVGWYEHDGGYIDNVPVTRTYPTSGITIDNFARAKKNYNDVDTYGGRAQLGIELNDSWTVTPALMAQVQKTGGIFAEDSTLGDLQVGHFYPETSNDRWYQAALTITGKIADFDITYSGAYLQRKVETRSDYTDYSYFYDQCCGYGNYIKNNAGQLINPSQHINGTDRYTKLSQELRVASPSDKRFRIIAGLFYQRQTHNIEQNYVIDGLADVDQVTGTVDDYWLTKQLRIDRDYAVFGQADFDVTDRLTLTGGLRYYKYDNTLIGFYGFGPTGGGTILDEDGNVRNFSSQGQRSCFGGPNGPVAVKGGPCTDLGVLNADGSISPKRAKDTGFTYKASANYKFDADHLVYATWSRGFRPGGLNRRGTLAPYGADYLTNYEIGTKNTFFDRRLTVNATLFQEEWKDVQLASLGQNGLTNIANVGSARIRGAEADIRLQVRGGFSLAASATYTDAKLKQDYFIGTDLQAPKGQALPITPKFKSNIIARYEFPLAGFDAHVQAAATYQSGSWPDIRTLERSIIGRQKGYANIDLTAGGAKGGFTYELFVKNLFDRRADIARYAECAETVCKSEIYRTIIQPRTFGIRFGQKF